MAASSPHLAQRLLLPSPSLASASRHPWGNGWILAKISIQHETDAIGYEFGHRHAAGLLLRLLLGSRMLELVPLTAGGAIVTSISNGPDLERAALDASPQPQEQA
ncbi:hypothetical protein ANO11243_080030 [Dothideomycetidae sp. 11243]|nr:hypothetical protein ANO11243_080030 [fungal sp. No.11243]